MAATLEDLKKLVRSRTSNFLPIRQANNPRPNGLPAEVIVEKSPRSGLENMQIDESMLRSVVKGTAKTLVRVYRWDAPTISVGHFQKSVELPARFRECPVVNRLTGGGAILHDREITYSIAVSADHPFRHEPTQAYVVVHDAIIRLLQEFGVKCRMRGETNTPPDGKKSDDEFLCFLRNDPRDVVIGDDKIIGSAQRRRKGNILQHGSILLGASRLAPEIPGIDDLAEDFSEADFQTRVANVIAKAI